VDASFGSALIKIRWSQARSCGSAALLASEDKAVLFFEVPDLRLAIAAIGQDRLVQSEGTWAVLHDPEDHNILLLQRSNRVCPAAIRVNHFA
jgi:hypothetical protein